MPYMNITIFEQHLILRCDHSLEPSPRDDSNKWSQHKNRFRNMKDKIWKTHYKILFISYKFVKGFLAITFLLLLISSWNLYNVCQCFLYNQEQNFSWIRQKTRNFPICLLSDQAEFCSWLYKNVDTHHESFS